MGKTDGVRRRGKRSFQIRYYDTNGIRQEETVKAANASEAAGIRADRLAQIAKGIPVTSRVTQVRFEELCADVVNHYIVNSHRSMADIEARYRVHILPALGNRRAATITTAQLNAYILSRRSDNPAPKSGTINREMEAIRRAFMLAKDGGKLLTVPKVPTIEENNIRTGFFTREEVERLCRFMPKPLDSFVMLAFLTAWRKDELRQLKWTNVDFTAGEIRLDPGTTKSGEGRVYPMSFEIRRILEGLPKTGLYVFMIDGRPIGEFRKTWKTANYKAGLPCVMNTKNRPIKAIRIFHDLRRSGVKELISKGIPERVVMELCGWKTRSVLDRYHIVGIADLRNAVRLMNGVNYRDNSGFGTRES